MVHVTYAKSRQFCNPDPDDPQSMVLALKAGKLNGRAAVNFNAGLQVGHKRRGSDVPRPLGRSQGEPRDVGINIRSCACYATETTLQSSFTRFPMVVLLRRKVID